MKTQEVISHIVNWLDKYSQQSRTDGYVIGISGGIDSAVTSTLCAMTGRKILLVEMPIYQAESQVSRGMEHINHLTGKFPAATALRIELTKTFDSLMETLPKVDDQQTTNLSLANTRARLRMTTLYYLAGIHHLLVAGTGNKVEDFGIGFFTKYGDGGVDLSPIADLTKTEVYSIAEELGIAKSIRSAAPTDGLWGDDRTDEVQIGASYPELEWAMAYINSGKSGEDSNLTDRQRKLIEIYTIRHNANRHKMDAIPVCLIPTELR